jgi:hypothetical protein
LVALAGSCPSRRLGVLGECLEACAHGVDSVGLGRGEVAGFGNVIGEIVEFRFTGREAKQFPIAHPHGSGVEVGALQEDGVVR